MASTPLFVAGLVVFDGAGVAWAAWELWKLRPRRADGRGPERSGEPSAFARPPAALPDPPRHAEGEHGPDHG